MIVGFNSKKSFLQLFVLFSQKVADVNGSLLLKKNCNNILRLLMFCNLNNIDNI